MARRKNPNFSGLFQKHELRPTFPQVIPTRSNCNNGNLGDHCKLPQWGLGLGWSRSWRHFRIKETASGDAMCSPVWIHYCKRPSFDFWISQGSVKTVTKRCGLNCGHIRQVSSWCCLPKIVKIGQCFMELFKQ